MVTSTRFLKLRRLHFVLGVTHNDAPLITPTPTLTPTPMPAVERDRPEEPPQGPGVEIGTGYHMPSARFAANGAWLAVQVMAHNLARWTARIGLGERTVITKTLRRRVFALVGRITRSARRLTLHLPRRWPWETQFSRALARLQAIPFPA